MSSYSNLVSVEWLNENLQRTNIVIIDCRFELGKPTWGREQFLLEHIPNSHYFDLEQDLSGAKQEHGGRHPLPDISLFVQKLERVGIGPEKLVIAYDDQGGAMASRLWWLLKYLGHEEVKVLDGGFSAWKKAGYPLSQEIIEPQPNSFTAQLQEDRVLSMAEVKNRVMDTECVIVDSRAKERYLGEQEDIDPVAGHIPGAIQEFWKDRLDSEGFWKTKGEQEQLLQKYVKASNKELVVYCGSGVTACVNVMAFEELGLKPKLYVGSWSDWCSYTENPVEKKTDKAW
ncbi:sulfurtransferase [Caldalkalibacillus mannanilyticus]|uniref:sulfurtransferase n=1 Tax=Caldalkalibacillus mannanilyticus TaxID=1418 RepID=UPI000469923D|nr:sulfurtransferase [Caldalkalibacillus mannanilyticus]